MRWRRLALMAGSLPIVWGIWLAADICAYSFASDSAAADAAIVLGAAVWNEQPSPVFEERIKHAINLYREGRVKVIIFTGGVGQHDQLAESTIARDYAIQRGVAPEDTFCETTSKITLENLQGAKKIVEHEHIGRVLIVSDPLHLRRSITMAHDLRLDAHPSPTPTTRYTSFRSKLQFLLREIYFYGAYLIERPFLALAGTDQGVVVQRYRSLCCAQSAIRKEGNNP
jgi:uncharacterized SAM-binding protein YcdF (DUF218 family)